MALAKTACPRLAGSVPRLRLFRLLDRLGRYPVTWVVSPPGAGKTTLVASYVRRRGLRTLWYQVDPGDRDIASFFYYLRHAAPHARRPLPFLTPEYLASVSTFARRFLREVFGRLGRRFAFVLDGYQEVGIDALLHEVLGEGLREVPAGGRVFIVSRTEPPPALARLRAERALAVVDWSALRLTVNESHSLARQLGDGRISARTIRTVARAADGWAAGVVLLLGRQAEGVPAGGPREQAPDALFAFFASEVFRATDATTQEVLLHAAFLPTMTGAMINALVGTADASPVLAGLARRHYFVHHHGGADPVYRLHPLFRAFLLARARATFPPKRLRAVQQAAATLLAQAGWVEDAAELLAEARDWRGLTSVIRAQGPALVAQGRAQTIEAWLGRLPKSQLARDPWLLYWQGMCRLPVDPGASRQWFERALTLFRPRGDPAGTFLAWSAAVDTFLHEGKDFAPLDGWIARLGEIRRELADYPSREVEARVTTSMASALVWRQPKNPETPAWLDRLRGLAEASNDPDLQLYARHVAWIHVAEMGNYGRIKADAQELRGLVDRGDASPLTRLMALFTVARSLHMTADFKGCRDAVAAGLELARTTGIRAWTAQFLGDQVACALSEGDLPTATRVLPLMARECEHGRRFDRKFYHYLAAWDALARGDFDRAATHVENTDWLGAPIVEIAVRMMAVHVAHERGDDVTAHRHLAGAFQLADREGIVHADFWAGMAAAQIAFDRGQHDLGLTQLRRALAVGRALGYVHHWPWRPRVMTRLCVEALQAGIEVEYVQHLVRVRHLIPEPPPLHVETWPWPLRIYTLGRFEVVRDDVLLTFSGKVPRRPLALLQTLIALGGQNVKESAVIDRLWPDADGDAAQQALAMAVYRLRRLLGIERAVERQGGLLALDSRTCWVDLRAFERMLSRADAALERSQKEPQELEAAEHWTARAATLYRGPFLGTEESAAWMTAVAEQVRIRWVRHLSRLADHLAHSGRLEEAMQGYQAALAVDPGAEEACRRLMDVYRQLGRLDQVAEVYDRCRQALAASLGIRPSHQTEALYTTILAR